MQDQSVEGKREDPHWKQSVRPCQDGGPMEVVPTVSWHSSGFSHCSGARALAISNSGLGWELTGLSQGTSQSLGLAHGLVV